MASGMDDYTDPRFHAKDDESQAVAAEDAN